ncbi:YheO-like PAS domain protein [Geomicrobium sp. JCM 19037]|uniref:helix-turn-helix transcriptional regulator n=1 Tax=unclassified Geomicrobium TaxID=2628951 RepID=UPI00045F253B|nr:MULTISPECIES: PAS domain-containing protein [unclassified Geomicrobium]GAK04920.1 YheO-like PAS domain protein [Geomicrobium sp. JCM 19037]GAK13249.1 YheO-like PAS domain protein [Geomicrobium sp. JCM 19039]
MNSVIFDQAIRSAEIIHKMLGSNCEVVVHDFSNLDESLIHSSGTLTQRDIGSPATDLVLKELQKPPEEVKDLANYSTTYDGIIMKSSTIFLRDIGGRVVGALCINLNISKLSSLQEELQQFLSIEDGTEANESFYSTVHDVIEEMVENVVSEFNKGIDHLSMDEKVDIVRRLDYKGAFLIKGAVEYLAQYLNVSKFTIYNYLQKIKTEKEYHIGKGGLNNG